MSAPTPALSRQAYAGLVSRVAALAIDAALVCVAAIAVRLLPEVAWEQVLGRTAPDWLIWTAGLAAFILPWAYFTVSWWSTGQTVGGLLLGLVVLRRDGEELSLPHAALRAAIGLLFALLWLVGLIVILWDDQRRAWHDRLFRTVVRYTERPGPVHAGP